LIEDVKSGDRHSTVAFVGTCVLLLAAPFERLQPIVSLPGQKLTTVEAAIVLALGAWVVALLCFRERPRVASAITAPWLLWLAVGIVAALAAPAFHLNALKVVARLAIGLMVALLALNGIQTSRRLAVAMTCAVASGVVVALLARLEFSGVAIVTAWLHGFRETVRVVGGQIRASGALQYPTIASMYLEIVFALGVGLLLRAIDRRAMFAAAVFFAALAIIAEGVIVTLTRSGLITIGVSLAVAGAWRHARVGADRGVVALAGLGAVIVALVGLSTSLESIRLRLTTDGRSDWYHAGFLAPQMLSVGRDSVNVVEVTVINKGRVTWDPDARPPFHVSYHWFNDDLTRVVRYDGLRAALPRAVKPGESARVQVQVHAPQYDGTYLLGWDVVQEGRLWFSTEPGSRLALSTVTVSGIGASGALATDNLRLIPQQAEYVGRPQLWLGAWRIATAHPFLGIGPDNYRLSYGPYAHVARADPRVTSNNMYLEILTGTGIVGLAVFLWLLRRAQRTMADARRQLVGPAASLYTGVVAAALAIAIHGLLDSFLTLTPTYLAIALTLGLAMSASGWTATEVHGASEFVDSEQCA